MLQLNYIRENKEEVISRLSIKNFEGKEIIDRVIELDIRRRETQKQLDDNLAEANQAAKEIHEKLRMENGELRMKNEELGIRNKNLKEKSKELKEKLGEIEKELNSLLVQIPNLPHASVGKGKTAEDNVVIHEEGGVRMENGEWRMENGEKGLPHWELGVKYGILDFERGVKITGAGFPVYKGKGAKLQRALINFFLDSAVKAGFTEIEPPVLINEESAFATGQLPDKDSQMYYVNLDNFYLVPTAEVPVTNLYRNEILKVEELPIKNTAYTSCFRREAGSYGKDVRGLNRLHQFDKVEIVVIEHPDKSYEMLEVMREYVSGLLRKLELPFRVLKLCGGDMSFTSALTYDMEVFSGGQKKWLEVSSISNFETFQSNRLKLRFRDTDGKIKLLHTLNGSALALPRIVAALLENNQSNDGIRIPEALREYTGFDVIM